MGIEDWDTLLGSDEKLVKRIFNNFDAYYLPGEKKNHSILNLELP